MTEETQKQEMVMENGDEYHIPVMLHETVEGLAIRPDGVYVDLTYGGGGHSREIMRHLGPDGRLYGFDQDMDAAGRAIDDSRFTFVRSNFRFLRNWMMYYGEEQVDGIVADLGVSSHHLDTADRGFSFRYDALLDMRMNQKASLTAEALVNGYDERKLADVLYLYGELKNSRQLAQALVKARERQPLHTTGDLVQALSPLMRGNREKKDLAKVFQALRIEVNGELRALRDMLGQVADLLRPGGRLSVITYHSLEDRLVKNMVRTGNVEGKAEADLFGQLHAPLRSVTRGVVTPSAEEVEHNPRSRSAKLRIAEKI